MTAAGFIRICKVITELIHRMEHNVWIIMNWHSFKFDYELKAKQTFAVTKEEFKSRVFVIQLFRNLTKSHAASLQLISDFQIWRRFPYFILLNKCHSLCLNSSSQFVLFIRHWPLLSWSNCIHDFSPFSLSSELKQNTIRGNYSRNWNSSGKNSLSVSIIVKPLIYAHRPSHLLSSSRPSLLDITIQTAVYDFTWSIFYVTISTNEKGKKRQKRRKKSYVEQITREFSLSRKSFLPAGSPRFTPLARHSSRKSHFLSLFTRTNGT